MSKSFQSFGKTFFTDLSTVITENALICLVCIAKHTGLSTFPQALSIGSHKLLSPDEVEKRTKFTKREVFASEGLRKILRLLQNDEFEDCRRYNERALQAAARYMGAFYRQRMLELKGSDVTMLSRAISGSPRLAALHVGLVNRNYCGSKELLHNSSYVEKATLLATGYCSNATTHVTRAMNKVVSAIVAASQGAIRKPINLTNLVCKIEVDVGDASDAGPGFPIELQLDRLILPDFKI